MSTCRRCHAPLAAFAERCPSCRVHLRPFQWLTKPSGWSQLGGYVVGTLAVFLLMDGLHAAGIPLTVVAGALLVLARRLHVRGR